MSDVDLFREAHSNIAEGVAIPLAARLAEAGITSAILEQRALLAVSRPGMRMSQTAIPPAGGVRYLSLVMRKKSRRHGTRK